MTERQRFVRASRRYRSTEAAMDQARIELRKAMEAARSEGMTLTEMAEVLGVTRQRVQQLLK